MKLFGIYMVAPPMVEILLSCQVEGKGRLWRLKTLWREALFAGLWCIWLARNCKIFNDWITSFYELWERAAVLATVWVKAHGYYPFIGITELHCI